MSPANSTLLHIKKKQALGSQALGSNLQNPIYEYFNMNQIMCGQREFGIDMEESLVKGKEKKILCFRCP
jgi:hypothetical protein